MKNRNKILIMSLIFSLATISYSNNNVDISSNGTNLNSANNGSSVNRENSVNSGSSINSSINSYSFDAMEDTNDNVFFTFIDGDVVERNGESRDLIELGDGKDVQRFSAKQDAYGKMANNLTAIDNEYVVSSKVFELDGIDDSFEPLNRRIYAFNTQFDNKVAYPVSRVYKAVVPRPIRKGIANFYGNFKEIPTFLNSMLQLKPKKAVNALGRFTVNSTVGILGIMDPATKMGMKADYETMGDTLGYYGVGSGSYLVLPILGPSTVRDATGLAVDTAVEGAARGVAEEKLFFDTGVFKEKPYKFTRPIVTGLNARSLIDFRYGDLNSPFEYDLVKIFYYNFRKLQIKK